MTIRAALARPRGSDPTQFEGVYLHNAGVPSELGPVLWTLMRDRYRFDAAGFSREMIDGNLAGWSNILCLDGPLAKSWDGKTKLTVEQHQANFEADLEDAGPTSFQGDPKRELAGVTAPPINAANLWGADLVYVIGAAGLSVVLPHGDSGPCSLVSTLPWSEEPDWDAVDDAFNEAYERLDEESRDDDGDDDSEDEDDDDGAYETEASNELVSATFSMVQAGDVAGARKKILDYLAKGGAKTPAVLTNLFFMLQHAPLPAAQQSAVVDEALASVKGTPSLLTRPLVENMCIVINNLSRGGESLELFELASAGGKRLSAGCYVGMTYGAFNSQKPELMRRAIQHVEEVMATQPDLLAGDPSVFDNTAALYLALGDKPKTLEYVRLCKTHGYRNFAEMPSMSDYAAIKDDPAFKKIFED